MTAFLTMQGADAFLGDRKVLDGADVLADIGELVAVVGPNGAGKSSLIKAFAGLLPLRGGVARLGGQDVGAMSVRARADCIAYLAQERRIAWNLPAIEVAALGAPFLSSVDALNRAKDALDEVEVGDLADRGVAEMSGGEQVRVLLARALVTGSRALLMDEPIAGLDPNAQLMILERLKARARNGQAVLVSLHDLSLAARFADKVVVMHAGRVAAHAHPMEALTPEILQHVFGLSGAWIETPEGPVLATRRYSEGSADGSVSTGSPAAG